MNYLKIKNDVYDRFVDDITLLPIVLPPGTTFDGDELHIKDDKYEEDISIPGDLRTMKLIQKYANSLDTNIKVTFDIPSLNEVVSEQKMSFCTSQAEKSPKTL